MGFGWSYRRTRKELRACAAERWEDVTDAKFVGATTIKFDGRCRKSGHMASVHMYHETDIVVSWHNGGFTFDNGGWDTKTTRARMGTYGFNGYTWYRNTPFNRKLMVSPEGQYVSDLSNDVVKEQKTLMRVRDTHGRRVNAESVDFFVWLAKKVDAMPRAKQGPRWRSVEDALADPWGSKHSGLMTSYARKFVREGGEL